MQNKRDNLLKLVFSALFLALAMVLPLLTGQLQQLGNALCPMHIPVLLCGFLCGEWYGMAVGFIAPLLRFALFGLPPLVPTGIAMCFELACYGFISGLMYRLLPKKKAYIYLSLLTAMLAGRAVWGAARAVLYGLGKSEFGMAAFIAGAFTNALPGIALQIVLLPVLVMAAERMTVKRGG